jgi:simple sugar transport system permease protein
MMRAGAFAAAVLALHVPTGLAVIFGMVAGALLASVHATLSIRLKADQVVSGMALNLVALAGGTFLLESLFGPASTPPIQQLQRWGLGTLERIPLARAFFGHSSLTYLALLVPLGLDVLIYRTPTGLRIRAAGEKPAAADTSGVSVPQIRFASVIFGGLLAGLGGAALSTATLDRFEHHMPAGLGFMAVAAMVFGRWTPLGSFGAAVFFSFGNALRIGLASSAPQIFQVIPQGFLLALPYLLTLTVLVIQGRRTRAPADLGRPYPAEAR